MKLLKTTAFPRRESHCGRREGGTRLEAADRDAHVKIHVLNKAKGRKNSLKLVKNFEGERQNQNKLEVIFYHLFNVTCGVCKNAKQAPRVRIL